MAVEHHNAAPRLVATFLSGLGSTFSALQAFLAVIFDDLVPTLECTFPVGVSDGVEGSRVVQLSCQGGRTIVQRARDIAFAPFTGVFLARVSNGRTIRDYVLSALIFSSISRYVRRAIVGGALCAVQMTIVIGALSFGIVMVPTDFALHKAMWGGGVRKAAGRPMTHGDAGPGYALEMTE